MCNDSVHYHSVIWAQTSIFLILACEGRSLIPVCLSSACSGTHPQQSRARPHRVFEALEGTAVARVQIGPAERDWTTEDA